MVKALDGLTLDNKIHAAGWSFFFLAGEVKVMFFGAIRSTKSPEGVEANLAESKATEL